MFCEETAKEEAENHDYDGANLSGSEGAGLPPSESHTMEGVGYVEVGSALARLAGRVRMSRAWQHQTATDKAGQKNRKEEREDECTETERRPRIWRE